MGRYDGVIVFDPIDKATAAALMMGVCAIENVFNQTLRAITEDEIEGVLDKSSWILLVLLLELYCWREGKLFISQRKI